MKKLTLILLSSAFWIFVGELLVGAIKPQMTVVPYLDHVNGIACLRPNVSGMLTFPGLYRHEIRTNAQRFRADKEFFPLAGPGVTRIAMLGDSFTFGFGAEQQDSYPAQLERLISKRMRVEVINAGVVSTGTTEQIEWYEQGVRRFHPDLVILTVLANDVHDNEARKSARFIAEAQGITKKIPGYAFISQRSQLFALLKTFILERGTKSDAAPKGEIGGITKAAWAKGVADLPLEIERFHRRLQKSGTRLLVVYAPAEEELAKAKTVPGSYRWMGETIRAALRSRMAASGIPYVDLTQYIRATQTDFASLYWHGMDTHPTPKGYGVFAEGVYRFGVLAAAWRHAIVGWVSSRSAQGLVPKQGETASQHSVEYDHARGRRTASAAPAVAPPP